MKKIFSILFIFALVMSCTQFLEEEETVTNAYEGDDGCIYCHTNEDRLKALAKEEEGGEGGGAVG
ncbi:MAG: hypothetical protein GF313_01390 [Caldithrix sp.]|nr:hypothetical protein [Caldithrix sp.]